MKATASDGAGQVVGLAAGVYAHGGEIGAQAGLQLALDSRIQAAAAAGRGVDALDQGGIRSGCARLRATLHHALARYKGSGLGGPPMAWGEPGPKPRLGGSRAPTST